MTRLLWVGILTLLLGGNVFADNTFEYNPKTGRLDLVLDNSNAGVITGSTATFTGYDCTTFSNGGTLTTDSAGNLRCADDDSAAGSGDSITVNGSAATDANFADTPTISWTLQTATSPDTVSGVVVAASITSTHLATDSVSADELNATGVEAELEAALDIAGEVSSTGMASTVIGADTVDLTTDTVGNYVQDLSCAETMSGCVAGAEDANPTIGVLGNSITSSHLNRTIILQDSDFFDFSSINDSSDGEGLKLPQSTSGGSGTADGQLHWDNSNDVLYAGDGTSAIRVGALPVVSGSDATITADNYNGFLSNLQSATEANVSTPMPTAIRFSQMRCKMVTAPGAGTSWDITVYINGSASSLTCQAADTATSCTDLSNSATATSGQTASVFWDATGSVAGTFEHQCSFLAEMQ